MVKLTDSDKKWVDEVWNKVEKKTLKTAVSCREKIPYTADENGRYNDMAKKEITCWTNGFWGGMMWLMYVNTKNEEYKKTAERAEELLDEAFKKHTGLHHDVGFMWHIVSGANYRLTGNEASRTRNLYAAHMLTSRYNPDGRYITAWPGEEQQGWTIIDSMMNIPLLYWAAEEEKADRYKMIAMHHADMAMNSHIRNDGSVNHIVVHDINTGETKEVLAGQGRSTDSCWSRGAAWAIYGFVLSYIHTKRKEYLDTAKRAANYFIAAACSDWLVRADFRAPDEPVIYDSTAACCAACGLIEIAENSDEYEKDMYLSAALNILKKTDEKFCNYDNEKDYIVGYGTERYTITGEGVHIPIIYADYFYIEALHKLKGNKFLMW